MRLYALVLILASTLFRGEVVCAQAIDSLQEPHPADAPVFSREERDAGLSSKVRRISGTRTWDDSPGGVSTAGFESPADSSEAAERTDAERIAELEAAVAKLSEGSAKLAEASEKLAKGLRVTTSDEEYKLILGGAVTADFLWNKPRPVGPGTPFFLAPGSAFGLSQDTFDAHARQTSLYALFSGPKVCCDWETGGIVLVNLYDNSIVQDVYGLLPILAFGQLKSEDTRIAAGLQLDIFNPLNPTVLPFSLLLASGNTGAYRGQARIERFIRTTGHSHVTLIAGLGDPLPTTVSSNFQQISEDNGKPNFEGRAAFAFGEAEGEGLQATRPFEVGVSGVVGEIRTTSVLGRRVVADVRGWGLDGRCEFARRFGVKGELFTGRTLGTYGAAVLQTINTDTFEGLSSRGGWGEVYCYWCRRPESGRALHTHVGFGVDDPDDGDLANGQILRNETFWATTLWDVTKSFRVGFEVAHRSTAYKLLQDNEGIGFQTQAQWKFLTPPTGSDRAPTICRLLLALWT